MEQPILTLAAAARVAGVTRQAMHKWCIEHGVGRKNGTIWVIDPTKLKKHMEKRSVKITS